GGYCGGAHLFPSRTEKLSPPAQMVLQFVGEYVAAFLLVNPDLFRSGFLFLYWCDVVRFSGLGSPPSASYYWLPSDPIKSLRGPRGFFINAPKFALMLFLYCPSFLEQRGSVLPIIM